MRRALRPAYPYFGNKYEAAPLVWDAVGDVPNCVEPFAGSAAIHFARPHDGKVVTLNELNGFITNFLRALAHAPDEVASWALWNVNEIDMHARKAWLEARADALEEQLRADPDHYDAKVAGWWVWGQCIWIGSGWCDPGKPESGKRPALGGHGGAVQRGYPKSGVGIFRDRMPHLIGPRNARKLEGQIPSLSGSDGSGVGYGREVVAFAFEVVAVGVCCTRAPELAGRRIDGSARWFRRSALQATPRRGSASPPWVVTVGSNATTTYGRGIFATGRREDLAAYLRALSEALDPKRVRITCGDWSRVVTPAVTISHGLTGVVLDPPYLPALRTKKLYAKDSAAAAAEARAWALANGDNPLLRIVLCGYAGEHAMPPSWRCVSWQAKGGYGLQANGAGRSNRALERLWMSPHCLGGELAAGPLFALRLVAAG